MTKDNIVNHLIDPRKGNLGSMGAALVKAANATKR